MAANMQIRQCWNARHRAGPRVGSRQHRNFGGDPGNVTIFGQSGGGGKVCTLMAMPSAQGLFHKAIVESGAMMSVGTEESSRALAASVLEKLGIPPSEVAKLHDVPYEKLELATRSAVPPINTTGIINFRRLGGRMGLSPVMDGKVVASNHLSPRRYQAPHRFRC